MNEAIPTRARQRADAASHTTLRFASRFVAVALAALAPACASADVEDLEMGYATGELLGAPIDPGHKFSVGVCAGPLEGGANADSGTCSAQRCTGTLVAPNVVLTAQHCVYELNYADTWCDSTFSDQPVTAAPVRITTSDSTIVGDPKWYEVSEILVPAKNLCHDDIALLVLKTAVPLREAFPVMMSLGRDVAKASPSEVAIVGRGSIAEWLDFETWSSTEDDGQLRRRVREHIPFVCASNTAPGCQVEDYTSPPTNIFSAPPSYFVIGNAVASGDSGSAVFDQRTFHSPLRRVLGVTSAGTFDADGNPNFGLVTRLDIHRQFLLGGLLKAARRAGRQQLSFLAHE